jgi:Ca-activated chloride channel homolog
MPFRYLRYALSIVALFFLIITIQPGNLPGQASSQKTPFDPKTIHVNVDLVNILCSVFNKNTNSFITNLTQNDFTLYEDDKKQEITNFIHEKDMPLTIALLIDTSESVTPKLKFEQEAAISFIQSVLRKEDRVMLLQFDTGVSLLQDFTNDPNRLTKQINKLKASGQTALYDAIYKTCDEKMIRAPGRKVMIILSDGDDDASGEADFKQATEMALRAETIIYAISTSQGGFFGVGIAGGEDKEGDTTLKEMAKETGGKVFFPFRVEDLEDSFRQISQELRSQYNIGYVSSNSKKDGSYRKLEIKIQERGMKLNYRKGYYAPAG